MFRVVFRVEFEGLVPSEVVENIHRLREYLSSKLRCVCSVLVTPLLCSCSGILVRMYIGRAEIRNVAIPTAPYFTLVVEGENPENLVAISNDLIEVIRYFGGRATLVE